MDVGLAARGLDEDDLTFDVALAEPEVLGADPDLAVVREREPLGRLRREEVHRGLPTKEATKRSTGRR